MSRLCLHQLAFLLTHTQLSALPLREELGKLSVDNPSYTKQSVSCDAPCGTAGELRRLPDLCVISRWIYVS